MKNSEIRNLQEREALAKRINAALAAAHAALGNLPLEEGAFDLRGKERMEAHYALSNQLLDAAMALRNAYGSATLL